MKKINYVKFALDLLMGIVFALFFNHRVLGGLMYHETAGLAIGAAIVIHLIFNHTWIHKITAALFQKGLPLKTRIGWIVDFLLLIDMFVMILAGISISKVLLPDLIPQVGILNRNTHIALACIALILLGIHLGLHWNWVMGMFRHICHINRSMPAGKWLARILTIIVVVSGIYNIATTGFLGQISRIGASSYAEGQHMETQPETSGSADSTSDGQQSFRKGGAPSADSASESADSSRTQNGHSGQNGSSEGAAGHSGANENGAANPFSVAATYLSIESVFIAGVYYLEILLRKKNKKTSAGTAPDPTH